MDERLRALGLVEAQRMAQALFADVMARNVIAPGNSEHETGNWIGDLARQVFGTAARRAEPVVRSGPHTVLPYEQELPDRVIGEDDIVVADLGPVLTGYETDFARTLAFGNDPHKHCLIEDLPKIFAAGRDAFYGDSRITGRQLYAEVQAVVAKAGWTLGGWHVGRLVGAPSAANSHTRQVSSFLCTDNDQPLRRSGPGGWQAHWILEIHLVDEHQGFGGSHKGLLDLT
ncbi:aminopeptidase P family protein [Streptomyces actinomycinicus]|uniref:Aminopeptidase P family protein n=2 Tax=Streptomyces actinomycinicus TaxID=1695166 RepID=A0A937JTE1_9ACTN|nr:aminopeptidase P family protein [Streptomyces actinomycinicus]